MLDSDPYLAMTPAQALQVLLASLQVVQVGNDLGEDGSQEPRSVFGLAKGGDPLAVKKQSFTLIYR